MTDRSKACWWLADEGAAAERVSAMAESLLSAYGRTRRTQMHVCRAVYDNERHPGFDEAGYYGHGASKYPVTTGGVDSVHSKLALSRPRPKITPGSRRFKAKRKAKTLQRYIDGLFKKNQTDKLQDDQLHDSMIYRAGVIKVVAKHGAVAHERRFPGDILTDPREERRSLRSMFELGACDREVLAEEFADGSKMRDRILDVTAPPEPDEMMGHDKGATLDQVKVVEAWRLPPCPGKPGRHIMAVGKIALFDEPWEWECFPFSILVWARSPESMWGQGMVQRGIGVQSMLNKHCHVIDEAFSRFVPKYAYLEGSCDPTVINRQVGQAVPYTTPGSPPTVLSPGPISPDFLGYRQELANTWFAVTGASQQDARSEADPALASGKAKLIQGDINAGRFYTQGKARERACVELAELSIKMADLLSDQRKGEVHDDAIDTYATEPGQLALAPADDEESDEEHPLDVPAGRDSWRPRIPYSAARMKGKGEEAYAIEVWPVSSLSQSIAGRMEEVAQLNADGLIADQQQYRELLDIPQLNDYQDLESARREAAEREIDACLDGEQGTPTSYWGVEGLTFARERAVNELCLAGIDDAPADVLNKLRGFIGAAEMQLQKLSTPPPANAAPVAAAPPMPEPPMMDGPPPMPMDPMVAA